jgi:hypothetical protein
MKHLILLAALLSLAAPAALADGGKQAADAALAAAKAAAAQADRLGVQWTSTLALIKAAQAAEASGDFAGAQAKAVQAEAMAKLSVTEAHEQETAWRAAVIR